MLPCCTRNASLFGGGPSSATIQTGRVWPGMSSVLITLPCRAASLRLSLIGCCSYLRTNRLLLALISLDLFAVLLGGVIRQTLVQVSTPDAMRGRVSAVQWICIGASSELGECESGAAAALLGAVPAALLGGLGTLVIVAIWARLFPELPRADKLTIEPAEARTA